MVKVQPVLTSVRFKVRANSPLRVGPQCAAVSPSKKPGAASTSSPAVRILIDERSNGEGLVVDTPVRRPASLTGFTYRSMVAGLMERSSSRTISL